MVNVCVGGGWGVRKGAGRGNDGEGDGKRQMVKEIGGEEEEGGVRAGVERMGWGLSIEGMGGLGCRGDGGAGHWGGGGREWRG